MTMKVLRLFSRLRPGRQVVQGYAPGADLQPGDEVQGVYNDGEDVQVRLGKVTRDLSKDPKYRAKVHMNGGHETRNLGEGCFEVEFDG